MPTTVTPCRVIPRVCPYGKGEPYAAHLDHANRIRVDLFLPHDRVNRGRLAVWDGCHNEADLSYYSATRRPRTPAERQAAAAAVRRYRQWMQSIPADFRQPVEVGERLPRNWRAVAWSQA